MDDEPAQGGAALPRGAGRGEDDALNGEVEVGGGRDDGRVVAAEFEQAPSETGGDAGADLASHAGGAGGADQRDTGIVDELFTDGAVAQQQAVHIAGGADLFGRPGQQPVAGERDQRGELGGLPDHGVAAGQGDGGVP